MDASQPFGLLTGKHCPSVNRTPTLSHSTMATGSGESLPVGSGESGNTVGIPSGSGAFTAAPQGEFELIGAQAAGLPEIQGVFAKAGGLPQPTGPPQVNVPPNVNPGMGQTPQAREPSPAPS